LVGVIVHCPLSIGLEKGSYYTNSQLGSRETGFIRSEVTEEFEEYQLFLRPHRFPKDVPLDVTHWPFRGEIKKRRNSS